MPPAFNLSQDQTLQLISAITFSPRLTRTPIPKDGHEPHPIQTRHGPHIASCEHQLHESPRQQPKDHHRRHPPAPTPIDCELLRNRLSARAPSGVVLHRREGIATSEQRRRGIVARLSASRNPSSCHARRRRFPARDPERASSSAGFGYFHLLWIHSQSAGDSRIVASRCRA